MLIQYNDLVIAIRIYLSALDNIVFAKVKKMINLIITDDHPVFLDGLNTVLSDVPDIKIIGEALNGKQLLEVLETKQPDVVLLDILMPGLDGIETLKTIKKKFPKIKTLMLSQFGEKGMVKKCIENGVDGYLLKDCGKVDLINAIRTVNSGGTYFRINNNFYDFNNEIPISSPNLSNREMEVLQMICKELTNIEIAQRLKISKLTVNTYRARLMQKAGVRKVIGLYKWALENKLIDL
jgi:DNA-binding NarL/FixJ family response regulator